MQTFTFLVAGINYMFVEKPMMNIEVLLISRVRKLFSGSKPAVASALSKQSTPTPDINVESTERGE